MLLLLQQLQQLEHTKVCMNFVKLLIAGVGSPADMPSMSSVLPKSPIIGPPLSPSIPAPYISPTLVGKISAPPPPVVVSLSDVQPIGLGAQNGCIGPGPVQTAYQVLQLNQTFSRFLGFAQQAGKSVICMPIHPHISAWILRETTARGQLARRGGALWWAYTFVLSCSFWHLCIKASLHNPEPWLGFLQILSYVEISYEQVTCILITQ